MKVIILRGKVNKKFFGIQVVYKNYILQYAYWKFGIFNIKTYKWWPKWKI